MEVDAGTKAPDKANDKTEAKTTTTTRGGMDDIRRIVTMIQRAVSTNQARLITRALRHNAPVRANATKAILIEAVETYFPEDHVSRATLIAQTGNLPDGQSGNDMADDAVATAEKDGDEKKTELPTDILPEVEVYLSLLVITTLLRHSLTEDAVAAAEALFQRASTFNRRSLDSLKAKVVFYLALAHEKRGTLSSLRGDLLAAHRTACLQHDELGQATLINLLLRDLLTHNLVEQAYKLVSKTNFPEKASNNQFCRYLYYTGRISAIQLEYGDAYSKLLQSLRKAPQNTAAEFRRSVQKLMIIVQLLMGDVPERVLFNQPEYRGFLDPYLAITKAVRAGDLMQFNQVVQQHKATFQQDSLYTLVVRLSHNVIKTGLRRINISYSRISMEDICAKLHLDSPQSAEFVCAKAIRDGVIDAVLDHENGWMKSSETSNVYATEEPQRAFHKRIEFCLDVHNEAVRAMRYPDDLNKKQPDKTGEPEKSEEEIAKEIEEELAEDMEE